MTQREAREGAWLPPNQVESDGDAGDTVVRRYFDWQEWITAAETNNTSRGKYGSGNDSWAGGSWDDAVAMASGEGYTAAIAEAEDMARIIAADLEEHLLPTFDFSFDVAGDEVDIGRYLSGDPECMVQTVPMKVMRTGRVLKVVVPVCYSAAVHEETVRKRGAAVMALVNCFILMQHTVEIWASISIHGNKDARRKVANPRLNYMVKVQESDQPLDMGRIMFALAHPTMLRQLGFAVEDGEDGDTRRMMGIGAGYGTAPYGNIPEDADINAENAIVLPELTMRETWSVDHSVNWIRQQINRIEELSS